MCACFGPNREEAPSQPSPLSRQAIDCDGCDDGDGHCLLLRSRNAHMPRAKGVLPRQNPMRGGASAALRHRPIRKQGLQGLRFAPCCASQWAERHASAGVGGIEGTQKVRTSVRTGFAGLHPGARKTAALTSDTRGSRNWTPLPLRHDLQEMESTCGGAIVDEAPFM